MTVASLCDLHPAPLVVASYLRASAIIQAALSLWQIQIRCRLAPHGAGPAAYVDVSAAPGFAACVAVIARLLNRTPPQRTPVTGYCAWPRGYGAIDSRFCFGVPAAVPVGVGRGRRSPQSASAPAPAQRRCACSHLGNGNRAAAERRSAFCCQGLVIATGGVTEAARAWGAPRPSPRLACQRTCTEGDLTAIPQW